MGCDEHPEFFRALHQAFIINPMEFTMTSLIPSTAVSMVDGKAMVSSRDLALSFQRKHKDVLRDIERISSMCPKFFIERNFAPNEYIDSIGRSLPCYLLTRDAFSLLAMGFTGKAAIMWKLQYIEAFNALEAAALEGLRAQITAARSESASRVLSLSPSERLRMQKALGYKKRGFTQREAAAVMGIHQRKVGYLLKVARELGLIDAVAALAVGASRTDKDSTAIRKAHSSPNGCREV